VNKAATNIENARGPLATVTAPNGSGQDRGRTLDCSARPGRNPSCTEPPKSRLKESDALIVKTYATSASTTGSRSQAAIA
jgi:hypothetical protein